MEALAKSGTGLDTTDSVEKWTALHFASAYGKTDCVQLLCAGGANVNVKDAFGRAPIYLASQRGHAQVVATLVAAGADVEAEANDGCTAFDFPRNETIVANLNEGLEDAAGSEQLHVRPLDAGAHGLLNARHCTRVFVYVFVVCVRVCVVCVCVCVLYACVCVCVL